MSHTQEGVIHKVMETVDRGKEKSFLCREFVLEIAGEWPQYVAFQLVQDRCDLVRAEDVGQPVTVHFDLRGRMWNDKALTNLNAWKIERTIDTRTTKDHSTALAVANSAPVVVSVDKETGEVLDDDLPF